MPGQGRVTSFPQVLECQQGPLCLNYDLAPVQVSFSIEAKVRGCPQKKEEVLHHQACGLQSLTVAGHFRL